MSADRTLELDCSESWNHLLGAWRLRDSERGRRNLQSLAATLGPENVRLLIAPLTRFLPRTADPDMALNNLERFMSHAQASSLLPEMLNQRGKLLEVLLSLFSTSQLFSDLLALQPNSLEMLRLPFRRGQRYTDLVDQLQEEVEWAADDSSLLRTFSRFRRSHLLRIGTNDVIRDRTLEEVTRDISRVAEAALSVAYRTAMTHVSLKYGQPFTGDGRPITSVVFAFGKLGGEELNYSSDIDLMFLYSEEGQTRGGISIPADEYFGRVVSELLRLLGSHTDEGQAYRIDLRLRPEGHRGPLSRSLHSTLAYYDTLGRTWERQALIKVRPVAGDFELGDRFLREIEPFVYRKYLSFAEINDIKALKRRIEQKAKQAGADQREVKTGRGGIRDIEFTIQFLQLLNGGDLPELRQRNTLMALAALEKEGCLTHQEYRVLEDAYRFLRRVEHRLQLLFDLQTHRLPEGEDELAKLALRMGYSTPTAPRKTARVPRPDRKKGTPQTPRPDDVLVDDPSSREDREPPLQAFLRDYRDKTEPTRRILEHLLHQTFAGRPEYSQPESDLLLDPAPDSETIREVLGRYPFRDVAGAYNNLIQLGQEVPFLSARRCRHFLASIAPSLLGAIAETPDPDMALLNLEKVTRSLGGKTVLWELFSFNTPSLKLYVDLCAWSQFLSEILINNPGMIDELLDSLVLNQPRSRVDLSSELFELCKGVTEAGGLDIILHSFQDKELLRIGVRDILRKDTIQETTTALSDLAETILTQVASWQEESLVRRLGRPVIEGTDRACRYALIALGKLGAREMNYHSDLDLMLIYEADGKTQPDTEDSPARWDEGTDNYHYFTELCQRIIRTLSHHGPMGRLYQVDMRLRPTGKSGSLVIPMSEFRRYFRPEPGEGGAQLWERQALLRGRVVFGEPAFAEEVLAALRGGVHGVPWQDSWIHEIASMRDRLEASRSPRDLKRGPGGLADLEFLSQMFQLKYGPGEPALRTTNTWQILNALLETGKIDAATHADLRAGYGFLLRVQNRLRIVHNRTLDAIPESPEEVEKLARRLGFETAQRFLEQFSLHRGRIRELYHALLKREQV